MRVQLVDPRGDVTPYDHALSAALARRGADVELVTSRFVYGPIPAERDYELNELFYRRATRGGRGRRARRLLRLLEHVPDMLRYRHLGGQPDIRHFQWLPLEALDGFLLPAGSPRVMTMHNVRRRGSAANAKRLADRMDSLIVHTQDAADLLAELGVEPPKVDVVPHGAFEHLTHQRDEVPLPDELAGVEGPVVLSFGMIRPYKGIDVLLEAFREVEGAELWIVGRRLDEEPLTDLEELARRVPGKVRFVTRYVTEPEIPAFFRRADVVALPYRTIDQSGVLYTALAFGKPLILSAVGGFVEVAEQHGAGLLVPPGEPGPLAEAIKRVLAEPELRAQLGERATAAAAGPYSWDAIAERTLAIYERLLAR